MDERMRVLVIAGSWNTIQFSPKWIKDNLLEPPVPEKTNITFTIQNDRIISKSFQIGKTSIEVSSERICFIGSQNDKDELDKIIELSEKIATLLPHTPITGLGINLRYEMKNEISTEDEVIDYDGYTLMKYSKNFSFSCKDNGKKTVNLIRSKKAGSKDVIYDCNIHHIVTNTGELKRYLEPDIFTKSEDAAQKLIEGFGNGLS